MNFEPMNTYKSPSGNFTTCAPHTLEDKVCTMEKETFKDFQRQWGLEGFDTLLFHRLIVKDSDCGFQSWGISFFSLPKEIYYD